MANAAQNKRLFELDALRGIAAFAVVLFHFTFGYDNGIGTLSPGKFYFRYGYLGVNLFFMISGFVIFMTLEKTKDTRSFVISRFSRLYPAYWAAIILTVLLSILMAAPFQKNIYTPMQVLVNFTMVQSWFKIKDVDGAYWTLAVELVFYGWMWFIFRLKKLNQVEWFCLAWILLSVFASAFNFPFRKYISVICITKYAPLFMAGILFYLLKKRGEGLLLHTLILTSLLAEFYILRPGITVMNPSASLQIIPYLVVGSFYIVFYLFAYNKLAFLSNKVLVFVGGISYSLYLVHENIGYGIIYWLKKVMDYQVFYIPVAIFAVVSLAYLVNRYIEMPVMNRIRKYYKTKESSQNKSVTTDRPVSVKQA